MPGRDTRRHVGLMMVLAIMGVLVGHAVVSGLTPGIHVHGPGTDHVHAYLGILTPAAVGIALIAVLQYALTARRRLLPPIPWRLLLGLQIVLFVLQEAAERYVVDGRPLGVLTEPILWTGVAVQAVMARLLPFLVDRTLGLMRPWRLAATGRVAGPGRLIAPGVTTLSTVLALLTHHLQRRGPPAFVSAH